MRKEPKFKILTRKVPAKADWEGADVAPTAILCPYCNSKSHFTPLVKTGDLEYAWVIQKCDNCSQLVLTKYVWQGWLDSKPWLANVPESVFPYANPVANPSIPVEVAQDYVEAFTCYSAGAFNASVAMSRRAIQAAAILKGATPGKQLWEQIKQLEDKGLEKSLIDLATEIRLLGNVPASHPNEHDLTQRVQREECKAMLDFLEAFIESIFIRPAKIAKIREARKPSKKEEGQDS
jgi:hypothetical protein